MTASSPSPGTPGPDAVFAALADPTRREVLERLSINGPLTATALAREFPVSRQAVVKHLTALAGAGLVSAERAGREVRYQLVANQLEGAVDWLSRVGARWDTRLAALARQLEG